MFVDSHCHLDRLDLSAHSGDLNAALDAARARDVRQFLAIAVTLEDVEGLAGIARAHEDVVISAGVHPLHRVEREPDVEAIKACAGKPGYEFLTSQRADVQRAIDEAKAEKARHAVA